MDSPSVKANEALGSPFLKPMAFHAIPMQHKTTYFGHSISSTTLEMIHQLPKRINVEDLGKFTNLSIV
jgi:hypothetical protein